MKRIWLFLFGVCAVGCTPGRSAQGPAAGSRPSGKHALPPAESSSSEDAVLATVNGAPIRRSGLEPEVHERIRDIQNELAQRRFHVLWAGVEEAVDAHLMGQEAKRRKVSVEALRNEEIASKLEPPTDNEVQQFYDANAERIGAPFEVVGPHIKRQLEIKRARELEQSFMARLRRDADVIYDIPMPDLPRYDVAYEGAPSKGPKNAPVTLVEFADYECPYCAEAYRLVRDLMEVYPSQLRVIYRDFPLSQHPNARPAAEAAQCAHEQDKFWPYHDLLYANTDQLQSEDLLRYANEVGVNVAQFEACLRSERPKQLVRGHEKAAELYGVQGTPAIFVNGIKLIGLLPMPLMQALINNEIAKKNASGGE